MAEDKIAIENVNHPGKTERVDRAKYEAMRAAMLKVLPRKEPGLTPAEIGHAVLPYLPESAFPGGAKSGWWMKAVQLDLEAKGVIVRLKSPPVRLRRT